MTKLEIITDEKKLPTLKEAQKDGKSKELPYNSDASEVWVYHYGMTDAIVGDALLIKADARDGERW